MNEKYGFIYVWYDRKNQRYYVGSHWGTEDDGYICSSKWMSSAYKRRPEDFKRRVVERIYTSRHDLILAEHRWLSMMDKDKLATRLHTVKERKSARYYNIVDNAWNYWHVDEQRRKEIGEKISAANIGKSLPCTPEKAAAISAAKKKSFAKKFEETGMKFSDEHRQKMSIAKIGKTHTKEWKIKNSERLKQQWSDGTRSRMRGPMSDEHKEKISAGNRGKKLSDSQVESLKKSSSKTYTITFFDGRTEVIHGLKQYATDTGIKYVTLFKAAQHGNPIKKHGIQSVSL